MLLERDFCAFCDFLYAARTELTVIFSTRGLRLPLTDTAQRIKFFPIQYQRFSMNAQIAKRKKKQNKNEKPNQTGRIDDHIKKNKHTLQNTGIKYGRKQFETL